jgi:hypothetical protein
MSAIDFPNSPTVGQLFTVGETTWEWTGVVWEGSSVAIPGPTGPTGPTGATGSTGAAGPGVASGGSAGQILTKVSATNYDTQWSTLPATPANADTAKAIGYIGLPQTILSTGGLTLSAAHAGDHIYVTGASQTITIPANASVPFEIGTTVVLINANVTSTIAITTDTLRLAGTANTGARTLAAYGMATLVKVDATTWIASGNGLT